MIPVLLAFLLPLVVVNADTGNRVAVTSAFSASAVASGISLFSSSTPANSCGNSPSDTQIFINTNSGRSVKFSPVQLIRPDGKGGLEAVPEGLRYLRGLTASYEVSVASRQLDYHELSLTRVFF